MESHFAKPTVVYFMEQSDFISPAQINVGKLKKELKGRPILVMVGGGFCGGCKMAAPAFDEFAHTTRVRVACGVVPIDGAPNQKELGRALGAHCQLSSIPFFIIYDRNGKYVRHVQIRASPEAFGQLMAGL